MNFIKHPNLQNDILLIVIGLVGVLGSISMICASINSGSQKYTYQSNYSLTDKKSQILAMVDTRDFLTRQEKDAIVKELIGDKIKMFNFNEEETSKILNALNKN